MRPIVFDMVVITENDHKERVSRLLTVPHIVVYVRSFKPPHKRSAVSLNSSSEFLVGLWKRRYPLGRVVFHRLFGLEEIRTVARLYTTAHSKSIGNLGSYALVMLPFSLSSETELCSRVIAEPSVARAVHKELRGEVSLFKRSCVHGIYAANRRSGSHVCRINVIVIKKSDVRLCQYELCDSAFPISEILFLTVTQTAYLLCDTAFTRIYVCVHRAVKGNTYLGASVSAKHRAVLYQKDLNSLSSRRNSRRTASRTAAYNDKVILSALFDLV